MNETLRESVSTALTLLVFSVVCAGLLAWAYMTTRPSIAQSEQLQKMALVGQVLPQNGLERGFDNDPIRDAQVLPADPLLGLKRPGLAYVAAKAGQPVAVVLEAVAPDGYAGEIKLLIGIQANGQLSGVRVTAHKETPGLGDYIEIAKNPWITQFTGKSLSQPAEGGWKVRKDGGQFDAFAGATITPRAVVKAVHKALRYFSQHRATLLRVPSHVPSHTPAQPDAKSDVPASAGAQP